MAKQQAPDTEARPRCPGCNKHLVLYTNLSQRELDETPPWQKPLVWTPESCPYCERMTTMPFKMSAGKAWRMPAFDKTGGPTIVDVPKDVAKRARYMGVIQWDEGWRAAAGYEEKGAQACAKFKDDKTGEVYYQPVEAT